jgi:hypothetical protein
MWMKKCELNDDERLADDLGHQGLTRREFLTTGSAVAAGLALSVDSKGALAAQKSRKSADSDGYDGWQSPGNCGRWPVYRGRRY